MVTLSESVVLRAGAMLMATALMAGGICRGAEGGAEGLIKELASPDYPTRMAAIEKLADCGEEGVDGVFRGLFSDESNRDPEMRMLRGQVLRRIFERVVIGCGSPETGVEWARLLFVDKQGLAGAVPMVVKVRKGSPGDLAGLKPGDTIRAINDVRLPDGDSFLHFLSMLEEAKPGDKWKLQTWRLEMGEEKHRVVYGKSAGRVFANLVMGEGEREILRKEAPRQCDGWTQRNLRRLGLDAE